MSTEEIRAARLADLQAKLKAREGKPGMQQNIAAIQAQIAELEANETNYRNTKTGQFASLEHLIQNPETTVRAEAE